MSNWVPIKQENYSVYVWWVIRVFEIVTCIHIMANFWLSHWSVFFK